MFKLHHRITALIVFALSAPSVASNLWQKADSGMSVANVQSVFPEAVPSSTGSLGNGAKCQLALSDYEIASSKYKVCFFFLSGKLMQVMLSADQPSRPQFDTVLNLLRSKYGPELQAGEGLCKSGMMVTCDADWSLKSGTNVSLLFLQVGRNTPLININYQTRAAADASKL